MNITGAVDSLVRMLILLYLANINKYVCLITTVPTFKNHPVKVNEECFTLKQKQRVMGNVSPMMTTEMTMRKKEQQDEVPDSSVGSKF